MSFIIKIAASCRRCAFLSSLWRRYSRNTAICTSIVPIILEAPGNFRHPDNREPTRKEVDAFRPLLLSELQTIQPKLVVTFGRISLNCFQPDLKISLVHGQALQMQLKGMDFRFTLLPLYHPAAAMHNGKIRPMLEQDFLRINLVLV